MRRILATIVLACLLALPARGLALEPATATSGTELVSVPGVPDGERVTLEGEVISELLTGGEGHVWVNILSDGTGIGIWAPRELAGEIEIFGDWKHTGDAVRVTGVFNLACDVHGGDLDVHATEIELTGRGFERKHPVEYWKLGVAAAGAAAGLLGFRRMRRREEAEARG